MIDGVFVDANILLDILDGTRRFHTLSARWMEQALLDGIPLAISDDILTTVYYVGAKNHPRKRMLDFLDFLRLEFTILPFNSSTLEKALAHARQENNRDDFEDLLQIYCAQTHGYTHILTHDRHFPRISGITLIEAGDTIQ